MATVPEQTRSPVQVFKKPTIEIPPFTMTFEEPISDVKKGALKVNRCCQEGCKKKLSLTDFPCKCGKKHCAEHRPAEVHNCSYDYKESHNKFLLKTMDSAIIAKKIDQI